MSCSFAQIELGKPRRALGFLGDSWNHGTKSQAISRSSKRDSFPFSSSVSLVLLFSSSPFGVISCYNAEDRADDEGSGNSSGSEDMY